MVLIFYLVRESKYQNIKKMYKLQDLNKIELLLLCYKLGFQNLCPHIEDWEEEDTKPRILEIIESCLHSPSSWPQWYELYHFVIQEKLTLQRVFYYPGMCFQSKFKWHWDKGFEYKFARKISVRTFLLNTSTSSSS